MIELDPPIINEIHSDTAGKSVAIIVGIHGNEKGPQLEWDWLNSLQIERGTLYLIFANPTACELDERFMNVNLNRRFGQGHDEFPEDSLARTIEITLDLCDAALDLHMYNESMDRPFAICNAHSNDIAKLLPVNYIINTPDGSGGGTDDYMASKQKIGICFEIGSSERPTEYSDTIRRGVMAFLSSLGIIDQAIVTPISSPKILLKDTTKFVAADDLRFTKDYSSFDEIQRGEVICLENRRSITAPRDGYILFPRPNNPIGTEAFYTLIDADPTT